MRRRWTCPNRARLILCMYEEFACPRTGPLTGLFSLLPPELVNAVVASILTVPTEHCSYSVATDASVDVASLLQTCRGILQCLSCETLFEFSIRFQVYSIPSPSPVSFAALYMATTRIRMECEVLSMAIAHRLDHCSGNHCRSARQFLNSEMSKWSPQNKIEKRAAQGKRKRITLALRGTPMFLLGATSLGVLVCTPGEVLHMVPRIAKVLTPDAEFEIESRRPRKDEPLEARSTILWSNGAWKVTSDGGGLLHFGFTA